MSEKFKSGSGNTKMSSSSLLYAYDDFVFFDKEQEVGILHLQNGQELGTYPHVDGEIRAIQSYKDRVIVGFSNSELVCYSILCKLVMWQLQLQPGAREGEGGFVDIMLYSPMSSSMTNTGGSTFVGSSSTSDKVNGTGFGPQSVPSSSSNISSSNTPIKHDIIVAFTRKTVFGVNPISGEIKFKVNPTGMIGVFPSNNPIQSQNSVNLNGNIAAVTENGTIRTMSINNMTGGSPSGGSAATTPATSPTIPRGGNNNGGIRKSNSTTKFLSSNSMKLHSESIYDVKIQKNQLVIICGISENQEYSKFYPTTISVFMMNRTRFRRFNNRERFSNRNKVPELELANKIELEERMGSVTCCSVFDTYVYLADEISLHRFPLQGYADIKSLIVEETEGAGASGSSTANGGIVDGTVAPTGSSINLNSIIETFAGTGNGGSAYNNHKRSSYGSMYNMNSPPIVYSNIITCLDIDQHQIVVGMQNNMLYCFARDSFELRWKKKHRVNHQISSNAISSTSTTNNAGTTTTALSQIQEEGKKGITSIRIFADRGIVLTSSANDHMIRSWKLKEHGREANFLNGHVRGGGVFSLKILRGGFAGDPSLRLLSIGQDKFIRYWDVDRNTQIWSTYTCGIEVFALEYFRDHLFLGTNCLHGQGGGVSTRNGFGNRRHKGGLGESENAPEDIEAQSTDDFNSEGYDIQKWAINQQLAKNQLVWTCKLPHNMSRPISFAFTAQLVFVCTTSGRFYAIYEDSGILAFHVQAGFEPVVRMLATESIVISITKKGDIPTVIVGWDIETQTVSLNDIDMMVNRRDGQSSNVWSQMRQSLKNGVSPNNTDNDGISSSAVNASVQALMTSTAAEAMNSAHLLAKCDDKLWTNHIPNYEQFASLTENDKLLIVSDTNDVIMIDLTTGATLAEVNCHSRITGLKTMEENHLLVALADGNIYSIGGKSEAPLFSVMAGSPIADDSNPLELPMEMFNVKRMFFDYLHPTKFMIFMNVVTSATPTDGTNGMMINGSPKATSYRGFSGSPSKSPFSGIANQSFSTKPAKPGEQLLILCSNNLVRCCRYDEFGGASSMMINANSTSGFLWHTIIDPTQPLDADIIRYAFKFRNDMVIIVKDTTVMGLNAFDGSIVFELNDEQGHHIDQAMIVTDNFLCLSTVKELKAHDLSMLSYWTVPCCVFDLASDLIEAREGRRGKLLDMSNTLACACCSSTRSRTGYGSGRGNVIGSGASSSSISSSAMILTDEGNCCCSCQCSHTIAGSCSSPLFARTMTVLATYRNLIALMLQIVLFLVETLQMFSFAFARVERHILPDYQRFQVVLEGFQRLISPSSASYEYGESHHMIVFEVYVYICWGIMILFILCLSSYEWLAWRAFKAPTSMYPKWTAIAGCCADIITGPLIIPLTSTCLSTAVCLNHNILHGQLREQRSIQCSSGRHIGLIVPTLVILPCFFLTTFRLKRVKNRMDAIQMNLFDIRRVQVSFENYEITDLILLVLQIIQPVRTHPLTYTSHSYLLVTLSASIAFVIINLFATSEIAVILNMILASSLLINSCVFPPFPDVNSNRLAVLVNTVMVWHFMVALINEIKGNEYVTYSLLWTEFSIFIVGIVCIYCFRKQFHLEQQYENKDLATIMAGRVEEDPQEGEEESVAGGETSSIANGSQQPVNTDSLPVPPTIAINSSQSEEEGERDGRGVLVVQSEEEILNGSVV